MAGYEIPGIPANCQILHVEQEIVGDDTTVIGSVLACDTERSELLEQEEEILSQLNKRSELLKQEEEILSQLNKVVAGGRVAVEVAGAMVVVVVVLLACNTESSELLKQEEEILLQLNKVS
eukprot:gene6024-12748_t